MGSTLSLPQRTIDKYDLTNDDIELVSGFVCPIHTIDIFKKNLRILLRLVETNRLGALKYSHQDIGIFDEMNDYIKYRTNAFETRPFKFINNYIFDDKNLYKLLLVNNFNYFDILLVIANRKQYTEIVQFLMELHEKIYTNPPNNITNNNHPT